MRTKHAALTEDSGTIRIFHRLYQTLFLAAALAAIFASLTTAPDQTTTVVTAAMATAAAILLVAGGLTFGPCWPLVLTPPLLILAGALLAMKENPEWPLGLATFLGNVQLLSWTTLLLRALTLAAALLVLAIVCPFSGLGRCLFLLAVSSLAIYLLHPIYAWMNEPRTDDATNKILTFLLLPCMGLLTGAGLAFRRFRTWEHAAARMGRSAIPHMVRRAGSRASSTGLVLLDGWIDPLGRVAALARNLADATTDTDKKDALAPILKSMRQPEGRALPLSLHCRRYIEGLGDTRPEAQIALAEDEFLRGMESGGLVLLTTLLGKLPLRGNWIAELAMESLMRHAGRLSANEQDDIWSSHVGAMQGATGHSPVSSSASHDYFPDLATLAIIALNHGLHSQLTEQLGKVASGTGPKACAAQLLLDCQVLRQDATELTTARRLLGSWPALPPFIAQRMLAPLLQQAASQSDIADRCRFFRKSDRPQILLAAEAPLTSIYGSRITSWTFTEAPHATDPLHAFAMEHFPGLMPNRPEPKYFAITGHGPGPVCARVSSILNELAEERQCREDLVLAGACFFDLNHQPAARLAPAPARNMDEIRRRAESHARKMGVGELFERLGPAANEILNLFVERTSLRPTLEGTREKLREIAAEMGFVENEERDNTVRLATQKVLENQTRPGEETRSSSFPILTAYKRGNQPLQIRLPRFCIGLDEYQRTTQEYARSVRFERLREWERRRSKYEEWAGNFAASYRRLITHPPHILDATTTYIHYEVDSTTATERRLDPPRPELESNFLARLPQSIISQLGYLALAEIEIEGLQRQFHAPHWVQTCLVDAFLRGWPLPSEDETLNKSREEWTNRWRPLALLALEHCIAGQGLALTDAVVENTVFRVAAADDDWLTLDVLHIWDPANDPLPRTGPAHTTLFTPGFPARKISAQSADTAQQDAIRSFQSALTSAPISSSRLREALCWDSGAVMDLLTQQLRAPFHYPALDADIARVAKFALARQDPLLAYSLKTKLTACHTTLEHLQLAIKCGDEGRKPGAVPEFLAWELHLIGSIVHGSVKNMCEQLRTHPTGILPLGIDGHCLRLLEGETPWKVVQILALGEPCSPTLETILHQHPNAGGMSRVRESWSLLERLDAAYAAECLKSSTVAKASPALQRFAPWSLQGWDRTCYDLMQGDEALRFVLLTGGHSGFSDLASLDNLLTKVRNHPIHPLFEELRILKDNLITQLDRYHRSADAVSLALAYGKVQQTALESLDTAQSCYGKAAMQDMEHGCGWLRLAALQWLTCDFRKAIFTLTGPLPDVDLSARQWPLGFALRREGAQMTFASHNPAAWDARMDHQIFLRRELPGELKFQCHLQDQIWEATFAQLSSGDAQLLEQFFTKYPQSKMHESAGAETFQAWLQQLRAPNLGQRARWARALRGAAEFPALAAAVHLGVPELLQTSPAATQTPARPAEWMHHEVAVQIQP